KTRPEVLEHVLEVYFEVMKASGIFGERLELRAMAHHCRRPIHLYYHTGWEQLYECAAFSKCVPSEVFHEDFEAEALVLYHTVRGKHFHVLLPRRSDLEANAEVDLDTAPQIMTPPTAVPLILPLEKSNGESDHDECKSVPVQQPQLHKLQQDSAANTARTSNSPGSPVSHKSLKCLL
ncbi:hypothetical protein CYMTET_31626, partial [Cymbomonas tetramitiformis]